MKNQSRFWSTQPVHKFGLRSMIKEGVIRDIKQVETDQMTNNLVEGHRFKTNGDLIDIHNLLTTNFINYSHNYLEWMCRNRNFNIILCDSHDKTIGCIVGRRVRINVRDTVLDSLYVDYMCLDKSARGRGYAPCLISKIVEGMKRAGIQTALFHKDDTPLPIQFISKHYYYGTEDLISYNKFSAPAGYKLTRLSGVNWKAAWGFLTRKLSEDYEVYQIFGQDDFRYYFGGKQGLVETWLLYYGDVICGLSNYVYERDEQDLVKIVYHISEGKEHNLVHDSIVLDKLVENGVKKLYLVDFRFHRSFLRYCRLAKMGATYNHMYNFFCDVDAKNVAV